MVASACASAESERPRERESEMPRVGVGFMGGFVVRVPVREFMETTGGFVIYAIAREVYAASCYWK